MSLVERVSTATLELCKKKIPRDIINIIIRKSFGKYFQNEWNNEVNCGEKCDECDFKYEETCDDRGSFVMTQHFHCKYMGCEITNHFHYHCRDCNMLGEHPHYHCKKCDYIDSFFPFRHKHCSQCDWVGESVHTHCSECDWVGETSHEHCKIEIESKESKWNSKTSLRIVKKKCGRTDIHRHCNECSWVSQTILPNQKKQPYHEHCTISSSCKRKYRHSHCQKCGWTSKPRPFQAHTCNTQTETKNELLSRIGNFFNFNGME